VFEGVETPDVEFMNDEEGWERRVLIMRITEQSCCSLLRMMVRLDIEPTAARLPEYIPGALPIELHSLGE